MTSLGEHLTGMAKLAPPDLLAIVRPIVSGWMTRQLLRMEQLLDAHDRKPAPWADDARRFIESLTRSVDHEPQLGRERDRLAACGQVLIAWPQLIQAAERIQERQESLLVGG